jgi:hypothetical protein
MGLQYGYGDGQRPAPLAGAAAAREPLPRRLGGHAGPTLASCMAVAAGRVVVSRSWEASPMVFWTTARVD